MELPTHCGSCGVLLMGGATVHKPKCAILRIIKKYYPHASLPVRARAIECMESVPKTEKS